MYKGLPRESHLSTSVPSEGPPPPERSRNLIKTRSDFRKGLSPWVLSTPVPFPQKSLLRLDWSAVPLYVLLFVLCFTSRNTGSRSYGVDAGPRGSLDPSPTYERERQPCTYRTSVKHMRGQLGIPVVC